MPFPPPRPRPLPLLLVLLLLAGRAGIAQAVGPRRALAQVLVSNGLGVGGIGGGFGGVGGGVVGTGLVSAAQPVVVVQPAPVVGT